MELNFRNYKKYNETNKAYNDFIQKFMSVIDLVVPIKERQVKQNFQEWFDGKIVDEIKNRNKLFKNLKNQNYTLTKISIMWQDINQGKWFLIKRYRFLKKKVSESIGKPKALWKALKSLGLPNRFSSCEVSAFKMKNTVEHDGN